MLKLFAVLAALLTAIPAQALEHRATGLKVELPEAFEIKEIPALQVFEAVIAVNLASGDMFGADVPNLCEVTFDRQPGWIGLTQARFNAKLGAPNYPYEFARQTSSVFNVLRSERFEMRGIVGQEFVLALKANPALLSVTNVMETPAGKTSVTCLASRDNIERALPIFRLILAGVTPPSGRR